MYIKSLQKKVVSLFWKGGALMAIMMPVTVVADQHDASLNGGSTLQNPLKDISSFGDLIAAILDIVVKIGMPIAVLFIIYSGFLFVTAQGSEEKLKKAKTSLLYTVLGTAILLGASVLANAIGSTIESLS